MRRRVINNRKKGSGGFGWALTLAVPALVVALALLLSPRAHKAAPLMEAQASQEEFVEGRHFDYFLKDSLLGLLQTVDSTGRFARIDSTADSLLILWRDGRKSERARIVLLRNRPLQSLKDLLGEEPPFAVQVSGKGAGLHLPIRQVNGRDMVPVPYDMIAGLMAERAQ